ncbi:MAG: hypothetical protein MK160_06025, partial [Rhodobacteraceae bacterium]|nr:hypothetical protein [Paracoccaceae bacterium]
MSDSGNAEYAERETLDVSGFKRVEMVRSVSHDKLARSCLILANFSSAAAADVSAFVERASEQILTSSGSQAHNLPDGKGIAFFRCLGSDVLITGTVQVAEFGATPEARERLADAVGFNASLTVFR